MYIPDELENLQPFEKRRLATIDDFQFADNGTAFSFTCTDRNTRMVFTQLHQHKTSSDITGQVLIETIEPTRCLHYQNINLMTVQGRETLVKQLDAKVDDVDWGTVVLDACYRVWQTYSHGADVQVIWGDLEDPEAVKPKYLIKPILYEGESNVLFGPGENGKSYLALLFCVLVTLPYTDNPFNLEVKSAKPLYLDYERSEFNHRERLTKICKGLGIAPISVDYRRCTIPFADDIDNLLRIVKEGGYTLVVIDSVGIACAGDLNSSETATRFAAALHRLPVTSLLITHTSKTEDGKKTPIGSVYFSTAPSNIFEVKKSQENGQDTANIALLHYKCNLGTKLGPVGFRFEFQPDRVGVTCQDISGMPQLSTTEPIRQQCKQALAQGPLTVKEIAGIIGFKEDSIKTTLNRNKDTFTKEGDKWLLKLA